MCKVAAARPAGVAAPAASFATVAARTALALGLWPLLLTVPLALRHNYDKVWPESWYAYEPSARPSPLGLSLGIGAVAVGQVWVLLYQYVRWRGSEALGELKKIQPNGASAAYDYKEGVLTHLAQPEGFVLLGVYLSVTWMLQMMPNSYYSFEGGIDLPRAFACLLLQDFLQYAMHRFEHKAHAAIYRISHKPHHRFTNPRLFDAFNGSLGDTLLMIVLPLYLTANLINCNVWTYMTFGSLYANWLCLIHSEFDHAWDGLFKAIGFGTAADHHVHHKLFSKNYGHLFMYWDVAGGTYKDAASVGAFQPNSVTQTGEVLAGDAARDAGKAD
ncbi:hypothetical protein M885DRAFT_511307 [Pelagophyceae sp. CCMP2097]|nr:hypothetical protein M885DRAFT_511307 [Pelagophyceae sp. CCMP2097]